MKKIILLLFFLFLFSGCTVEYNLSIEDSNYSENILISSDNKEDEKSIKNYSRPITAFYDDIGSSETSDKMPGIPYYNQELIFKDDANKLHFDFKFNDENFNRASSIRTCYQSFFSTKDETTKIISLSTSEEFLCFESYPVISKVDVNIKIENSVISNNADSIYNNIYTWHIDETNYQSKPISLSYKNGADNSNKENSDDNFSRNFIIALIVIGLFLVSIVGFLIYNVKKQNKER